MYNRANEIITYTVDDGFTVLICKLSRCTNENYYTNLALFLEKAILQLCRIIFVLSGSALAARRDFVKCMCKLCIFDAGLPSRS